MYICVHVNFILVVSLILVIYEMMSVLYNVFSATHMLSKLKALHFYTHKITWLLHRSDRLQHGQSVCCELVKPFT